MIVLEIVRGAPVTEATDDGQTAGVANGVK
jgi:hypothetical protein